MSRSDHFVYSIPCEACGKRGYLTKKDAKKVMKRVWAIPPDGERKAKNMYRCPETGRWHLTKIPKGEWRG